MKQLIIFLLLSISLFAQQNGKLVGNGAVWTDSLGYGVVATSDSVWILNVNFLYDDYRIFIKGNANSPVDSVKILPGTIRYYDSGVANDTIWGSQAALQDSAGNTVYTIVNNTVGKDFTLVHPATQLLQFVLLNHRATLVTRNTTLTIDAKK